VIPHERITILHGVSVMRVGLILFQLDLAQYDRANSGKLKAFAVLAFCAEMARLPGHWSPVFSPE
jgi:hypothetical protein